MESRNENEGVTPRRRRKRRFVLAILVMAAASVACIAYYYGIVAEERLQEAIAEAARDDPGWRILDLEAARRHIPDEENSAIPLTNAKANMTRQTFLAGSQEAKAWGELLAAQELEPPVLLSERQLALLQQELKRNATSIGEIYKIHHRPRGRYPISYSKDFISTSLAHTQATRELATLLDYDAMVRAHAQDMEGALLACRCLLLAQRAVGDEPMAVSMLVRIAIHQAAVKKLERVLAQGQPTEVALAGLQHLLEEELGEPLLLIAARGERAGMDGLLEALQTADFKSRWQASRTLLEGDDSSMQSIRFKLAFVPGSVKRDRALLLRYNNRIVELARLPVDEQRRRLRDFNFDTKDLPGVARQLTAFWPKLFNTYHRDQATLRCGVLLLASERYRRANGHWPQRLDDLVPSYVAKVPLDPFDGQPLRLARFDGGLTIYSVSQDGQDDGGKLSQNPLPGTDWGFRLWDVPKRRQAAASESASASPK
ncbi:MAG TPA: hypothetical protein VGY58_05560 [Gemmataceae bacterium]|jgi:hypothetical protein|nr:hypothetical protein [Gemmataceae bacterium]